MSDDVIGYLSVLKTNGSDSERLPICEAETRVGRDENADIRIRLQEVSRTAFILYNDQRKVSFINTSRIASQILLNNAPTPYREQITLRDGDIISVVGRNFRFNYVDGFVPSDSPNKIASKHDYTFTPSGDGVMSRIGSSQYSQSLGNMSTYVLNSSTPSMPSRTPSSIAAVSSAIPGSTSQYGLSSLRKSRASVGGVNTFVPVNLTDSFSDENVAPRRLSMTASNLLSESIILPQRTSIEPVSISSLPTPLRQSIQKLRTAEPASIRIRYQMMEISPENENENTDPQLSTSNIHEKSPTNDGITEIVEQNDTSTPDTSVSEVEKTYSSDDESVASDEIYCPENAEENTLLNTSNVDLDVVGFLYDNEEPAVSPGLPVQLVEPPTPLRVVPGSATKEVRTPLRSALKGSNSAKKSRTSPSMVSTFSSVLNSSSTFMRVLPTPVRNYIHTMRRSVSFGGEFQAFIPNKDDMRYSLIDDDNFEGLNRKNPPAEAVGTKRLRSPGPPTPFNLSFASIDEEDEEISDVSTTGGSKGSRSRVFNTDISNASGFNEKMLDAIDEMDQSRAPSTAKPANNSVNATNGIFASRTLDFSESLETNLADVSDISVESDTILPSTTSKENTESFEEASKSNDNPKLPTPIRQNINSRRQSYSSTSSASQMPTERVIVPVVSASAAEEKPLEIDVNTLPEPLKSVLSPPTASLPSGRLSIGSIRMIPLNETVDRCIVTVSNISSEGTPIVESECDVAFDIVSNDNSGLSGVTSEQLIERSEDGVVVEDPIELGIIAIAHDHAPTVSNEAVSATAAATSSTDDTIMATSESSAKKKPKSVKKKSRNSASKDFDIFYDVDAGAETEDDATHRKMSAFQVASSKTEKSSSEANDMAPIVTNESPAFISVSSNNKDRKKNSVLPLSSILNVPPIAATTTRSGQQKKEFPSFTPQPLLNLPTTEGASAVPTNTADIILEVYKKSGNAKMKRNRQSIIFNPSNDGLSTVDEDEDSEAEARMRDIDDSIVFESKKSKDVSKKGKKKSVATEIVHETDSAKKTSTKSKSRSGSISSSRSKVSDISDNESVSNVDSESETPTADSICASCASATAGRTKATFPCSSCGSRFHAKCVGLKKAPSAKEQWKCPKCCNDDAPLVSEEAESIPARIISEYTEESLATLKLADLKAIASDMGLPVSGTKALISSRILNHPSASDVTVNSSELSSNNQSSASKGTGRGKRGRSGSVESLESLDSVVSDSELASASKKSRRTRATK